MNTHFPHLGILFFTALASRPWKWTYRGTIIRSQKYDEDVGGIEEPTRWLSAKAQ